MEFKRVVVYFQLSVWFSLSVDSDLVVNEWHSAVITFLNANGEGDYNVIVEFGKCCNLN